MSLFVGRLNDKIRQRDLEDVFKKYGSLNRCEVKNGPNNSFAFVTFSDERDAEDAKKDLQGTELLGCKLNIEWAKESGRFSGGRGGGRSKDFNCYECGRPGHLARDCRERKTSKHSRSRSRSRDRGRRRRTRSRSRDRRRGSRSRSRSRDRSTRNRSRDRSGSRGKGRGPKEDGKERIKDDVRKESDGPAPEATNGDRPSTNEPDVE